MKSSAYIFDTSQQSSQERLYSCLVMKDFDRLCGKIPQIRKNDPFCREKLYLLPFVKGISLCFAEKFPCLGGKNPYIYLYKINFPFVKMNVHQHVRKKLFCLLGKNPLFCEEKTPLSVREKSPFLWGKAVGREKFQFVKRIFSCRWEGKIPFLRGKIIPLVCEERWGKEEKVFHSES